MTAIADALRWLDVALALLLAPACAACAVFAPAWDQRARFVTLAGYSAVTIGGQLGALGNPMTWPVPALAATTVAAVVSTAAYLLKARRALTTEGGSGGDARPAAGQRRVLRAGPAPGSGRHARRDPRPQGGGGPA